ncbi:MAG: zinc ABC transporter substrate-binding protein [Desulfobacterales bacterium]
MPEKSIKHIVIIISTLFIGQSVLAADRITVFVSINPQQYFVQQIGKDRVDVRVMVPPGASPATYEPRPKQMADLSAARVYFAIGVAFENAWLEKISAVNPGMKVVHTDNGIKKIPMADHFHPDQASRDYRKENHSDEDDRSGPGLDPHIWLSPPLVKIQARSILTALQDIDPGHQDRYAANYYQFIARIDELDADLKQTFAGKQHRQFMVFHPAWGYFGRAYGLQQVPIEIEGKSPKPARLKALIEHAREKGIRVIFVQPQFSSKSAELVAREIDGQVVLADPLAEDWLANLTAVADRFKAALK